MKKLYLICLLFGICAFTVQAQYTVTQYHVDKWTKTYHKNQFDELDYNSPYIIISLKDTEREFCYIAVSPNMGMIIGLSGLEYSALADEYKFLAKTKDGKITEIPIVAFNSSTFRVSTIEGNRVFMRLLSHGNVRFSLEGNEGAIHRSIAITDETIGIWRAAKSHLSGSQRFYEIWGDGKRK